MEPSLTSLSLRMVGATRGDFNLVQGMDARSFAGRLGRTSIILDSATHKVNMSWVVSFWNSEVEIHELIPYICTIGQAFSQDLLRPAFPSGRQLFSACSALVEFEASSLHCNAWSCALPLYNQLDKRRTSARCNQLCLRPDWGGPPEGKRNQSLLQISTSIGFCKAFQCQECWNTSSSMPGMQLGYTIHIFPSHSAVILVVWRLPASAKDILAK